MQEHRGIAVAIAVVIVGFLVTLPFTLAFAMWTVLSIYALVKMIGSAPDDANPIVVTVAIVLLVGTLGLALAGTITLVGRPMTPKRRRRSDTGFLPDDRVVGGFE